MQRRTRQPAQRGQRLEPGRHVRRRVGVHRAAAALVAGVHRRQQVADLRAADLTDHQPVRPHPQRLADQVGQGDRARAARRWPGAPPGGPRAGGRAQLAGVLHDHDPLAAAAPVRAAPPSRVVLPEPVPPLTRNASRGCDDPAQQLRPAGVSDPDATQSSREKLARAGTRSEMQVPGAARVPSTAWTRLPSASRASTNGDASSSRRPDRGGQPLGQPAHLAVVGEPELGQLQPGAAIDVHLVGAVDQHVGDPGLAQQRVQRSGTDPLPSQRLDRLDQRSSLTISPSPASRRATSAGVCGRRRSASRSPDRVEVDGPPPVISPHRMSPRLERPAAPRAAPAGRAWPTGCAPSGPVARRVRPPDQTRLVGHGAQQAPAPGPRPRSAASSSRGRPCRSTSHLARRLLQHGDQLPPRRDAAEVVPDHQHVRSRPPRRLQHGRSRSRGRRPR